MNDEYPDDEQYRSICAALKLAGWRKMPIKLEVREMRNAMLSAAVGEPGGYPFPAGYLFRHHPGTRWSFSETTPVVGGHALAEIVPLFSGAEARAEGATSAVGSDDHSKEAVTAEGSQTKP